MSDRATRIKQITRIIAVTVIAVFVITDIVHDFIANDPVHYFLEQPCQLLVVALIASIGCPIVLFFCRLSPVWQRRIKLLSLGSAATFLTVGGAYHAYRFYSHEFADMLEYRNRMLVYVDFFVMGFFALLLWFAFYFLFRNKNFLAD